MLNKIIYKIKNFFEDFRLFKSSMKTLKDEIETTV